MTRLLQALHEHRLSDAIAIAPEVEADTEPGGSLRCDLNRALAWYRHDLDGALESTRAQYEAHPDDEYCRDQLARDLTFAQRPAELARLLERHPESMALALYRVEQLRHRRFSLPTARALVRRRLRRHPTSAAAVAAYADVVAHGDRELERVCRRIASCLAPFDERLALASFRVCAVAGDSAAGIEFLRMRVAELGGRSGAPYGTLAEALASQHAHDEAISVLREGLARHEEDWLRLLLAQHLIEIGRRDDAAGLLEQSDGRIRPVDAALLRAQLATREGDFDAALDALDDGLAEHPADVRIQTLRLRLLTETEGHVAAAVEAVAHSHEIPEHPELAQMAVRCLVDAAEDRTAEEVLVKRLEDHPTESWPARPLVELLIRHGREDEAVEIVSRLVDQFDHLPAAWDAAALAWAAADDADRARRALHRSLRLDIDNPGGIRRLCGLTTNVAERRDELRAVAELMLERGPGDRALLTWSELAAGALPENEWLALLERIEAEFPAEPQPGEARVAALLRTGAAQAAADTARALADRFPARVEAQLLLFDAWTATGAIDAAQESARRAIRLDPRNVDAWTRLGESLEAAGRIDEAEATYRDAIRFNPGLVTGYGYLADLQWNDERAEEALLTLGRALKVDAGYGFGMMRAIEWLIELDRSQDALERAVEFVKARPRQATAHLAHAQALLALERVPESADALRRALRCDPRMSAARDQLVERLVDLERFDDAEEVLADGERLVGTDPAILGRAAWVTRRRGHTVRALAQMREVLAAYPEFDWGWRQTVEWLTEVENWTAILELADAPQPVLANAPWFWTAVAASARELDATDRIEAALRAAAESADSPGGAELLALLDWLDEHGRGHESADLLRSLEAPEAWEPQVVMRAAVLAAEEGERQRVATCYEALLRSGTDDVDALQRVSSLVEFHRSKWHELNRSLLGEDQDGVIACGLLKVADPLREPDRVREMLESLGRFSHHLDRLASVVADYAVRPTGPAIDQWVLAQARKPIAHTPLWAAIGRYLVERGRLREAQAVLQNHWQRDDADPRALADLAFVDHELGRDDRWHAVCAAIERAGETATAPLWRFHYVKAYYLLDNGELENARRLTRVGRETGRERSLAMAMIRLRIELEAPGFFGRILDYRRGFRELVRVFGHTRPLAEFPSDRRVFREIRARAWLRAPLFTSVLLRLGRFGLGFAIRQIRAQSN